MERWIRSKSGKPPEIRLVFCYNFIVSFIDCIFAVMVFRLHSVWERIFQALFLCFLTGSTEPGGHRGISLCVYNFILAVWQQSTQRMCKFILWVPFLYRSEPQGSPNLFSRGALRDAPCAGIHWSRTNIEDVVFTTYKRQLQIVSEEYRRTVNEKRPDKLTPLRAQQKSLHDHVKAGLSLAFMLFLYYNKG